MKSLSTLFNENKLFWTCDGSTGLDDMGFLQQIQDQQFRQRLKIYFSVVEIQ